MRGAIHWLPPLLVAVVLTGAAWAWLGRPVDLPPAPEEKLHCASYTPFRGSQTPFNPALIIPKPQIEEDLKQLHTVTDCIRTYAVNQGLDQAVPVAAALGMKVMLGIWIGRNPVDNEAQIATRHCARQGASRDRARHHRRQRGAAARRADRRDAGRHGHAHQGRERRPGHLCRRLGILAARPGRAEAVGRFHHHPHLALLGGRSAAGLRGGEAPGIHRRRGARGLSRPRDRDRRNRLAQRRPLARGRGPLDRQPGAVSARIPGLRQGA